MLGIAKYQYVIQLSVMNAIWTDQIVHVDLGPREYRFRNPTAYKPECPACRSNFSGGFLLLGAMAASGSVEHLNVVKHVASRRVPDQLLLTPGIADLACCCSDKQVAQFCQRLSQSPISIRVFHGVHQ